MLEREIWEGESDDLRCHFLILPRFLWKFFFLDIFMTMPKIFCRRRMPNARYRGDHFPRPVYGRVVHKQPVQPLQAMPGSGLYEPSVINRGATDDIPRIYANDNRNSGKPSQPRRLPKLRMGGGVVSNAGSNQNAGAMQAADIFGGTGLSSNLLTPQRGSFQRLKELVWTERAKELQQQRKNEEMVARAARLKELTNGQQ